LFFLTLRSPPSSPPFPYTTLFRSRGTKALCGAVIGSPVSHAADGENTVATPGHSDIGALPDGAPEPSLKSQRATRRRQRESPIRHIARSVDTAEHDSTQQGSNESIHAEGVRGGRVRHAGGKGSGTRGLISGRRTSAAPARCGSGAGRPRQWAPPARRSARAIGCAPPRAGSPSAAPRPSPAS